MHVDDEGVQEACDRVVQVIMRKEEGEEEDIPDMASAGGSGKLMGLENVEDDEDEKIVDVV
jgi:hypothetical protein